MAGPLHILFCLDYYFPHIGGAEILFQNLAEGLAARGHRVTIVTQLVPGAAREETLNGVRILRVHTWNSRYLFPMTALPTMLRLARDAEIVHTTTFAAAWPAALAAKWRGKPVVLTVHEVWIGMWRRVSDAGWLSNAMNDLFERTIYWPSYTRYVTVSHATERALARFVPQQRIQTIYNGLDYGLWKPQKTSARASLGLPEGTHLFFFSGRPGRSKGFPILLQALAKILPKHPQARLLALLSNRQKAATDGVTPDALIRKLGLSEHVILHDPVSRDDLPRWVSAADTVCVPSLSEGFGFAAAEASAIGIPVIVTDNASLPEVVGGKCLLVPPGDPQAFADAMARAIENRYDTRPLPHFDTAENIRHHEELYLTLTRPEASTP